MIKHFILTLCFQAALNAVVMAQNGDSPVIRVAIARNINSFRLTTSGKVYALDVTTGEKYVLLANSPYDIKAVNTRRLAVAGTFLNSPVKLTPVEPGDQVKLNGRRYRGEIYLNTTLENKLEVIENLPLESYLYGVLTAEMSPDWPLEALKAQAVASRTYALKNMNPKRDYDITDGADTQVYTGMQNINSRIRDAVDSTSGEILRYKGKVITAFFHAACGGHTAGVNSAWGDDIIKPLSGIKDPYCKNSRHYRWNIFASTGDLLTFIQRKGAGALKIKSIKPYKRDRAGRVTKVKFSTDAGSFSVETSELRKSVGTFDMKSTFITAIVPVKGGFEFSGRGWGHGVGLCQDGAKHQAIIGRNYKKILRFYYPGAEITEMEKDKS